MDDEMTDLIAPSAHEAFRATRVTREGLGADDVLRSVPTERQRDRDGHARRRQSTQRQGGKLSKRGKRKPARSFLPSDVGATEAVELTRKTVENPTFLELNTWEKAFRHLPTFARLGCPHKSRIIFAIEGITSNKWKKQATDWEQWGPSFAPLEEVAATVDPKT